MGLLTGLFLIIMGITGVILVFQHDIEEVLWKEYTQVEDFETLEIDRGFESIQQHYPDWDTRLMHFESNEALIFNLRKPTARLFVFVHPTSGEIIKELNELTTFTRWLLKFHYSFQAGPAGRIFVFVFGILFLLSLLTGIYLYRKLIIKTLLFQVKVNSKSKRSLFSSLHRIIGTWALLLNLLLVITGIFLAYKVSSASLQPPLIPDTPAVTAPIQKTLDSVKTSQPDFTPTYIRLPLSHEGSLTIYGIYDDDPFYYSEFGNYFQADYRTGTLTSKIKITEADILTKLSNTLIPLHFGQYGGIWSKLLYSLIGLSGPFLSISGFIIWQKGRTTKKRKRTSRQ